jgi:hypothetical protein
MSAGEIPGAGLDAPKPRPVSGSAWVWGAFVVLVVLHHDGWWWDDRRLVFGFLPIGLAYHAAYSLAAGILWALASRYAWPSHLEEWADEPGRAAASTAAGSGMEEGRQ